MRGFPKILKTAQDFANCEQLVSEGKLPKERLIHAYNALLATNQHYVYDKMLVTEPTKPAVDTKVMPVYDEQDVSKSEPVEYTQFKLVENLNSQLKRIGFTPETVTSKIATLEGVKADG